MAMFPFNEAILFRCVRACESVSDTMVEEVGMERFEFTSPICLDRFYADIETTFN